MKRLIKKSSSDNNFSRRMHREIELHVINGDNNRSKLEQANMAFVIAKRLIADLPLTPSNDLLYLLVDDIQAGVYDDLGTIDTADRNWGQWLRRTMDNLKRQGRIITYNTNTEKPIIEIRS